MAATPTLPAPLPCVPACTDQDPADINLNALTETNSGKLPKVGGARAMPKGAKSGGLFAGESAEPSPRRGNMTVKEEKRVRGCPHGVPARGVRPRAHRACCAGRR